MKEITNDNENLYVEDVTDNKEMDNVIIPGGSNLEDEEDLSSASSSVDSYEKNDDLMNILSKGKKMIKETYEDPIRMYLKEIGDVKLLSRKDEEVLARTIDLKFKYKKISSDLEESSSDLINSADVFKEVYAAILSTTCIKFCSILFPLLSANTTFLSVSAYIISQLSISS